MSRERPDALMILDDSLLFRYRASIVDFAAKKRLPAMYLFRESVEAGGLMAYSVSLSELHRRAAEYVDKILKGAQSADLPIEQPTKFELVINLKTAKALGLTDPAVAPAAGGSGDRVRWPRQRATHLLSVEASIRIRARGRRPSTAAKRSPSVRMRRSMISLPSAKM